MFCTEVGRAEGYFKLISFDFSSQQLSLLRPSQFTCFPHFLSALFLLHTHHQIFCSRRYDMLKLFETGKSHMALLALVPPLAPREGSIDQYHKPQRDGEILGQSCS